MRKGGGKGTYRHAGCTAVSFPLTSLSGVATPTLFCQMKFTSGGRSEMYLAIFLRRGLVTVLALIKREMLEMLMPTGPPAVMMGRMNFL